MRLSLLVPLGLGARRAEMATPSTAEVRDTLTLCRVLAFAFAFREARAFSW